MLKTVKGDLIKLALNGKFDVIAHGCNCFCYQGAGIAKQMSEIFCTDRFKGEELHNKGSINKLGTLQFLSTSDISRMYTLNTFDNIKLIVVNAYTQYKPGANLDYEALTLCLRKMNHGFKGMQIGLPQIGCGIAGGNWEVVKNIIEAELKDCKVTIVIYEQLL